jgi:hypothetical protein
LKIFDAEASPEDVMNEFFETHHYAGEAPDWRAAAPGDDDDGGEDDEDIDQVVERLFGAERNSVPVRTKEPVSVDENVPNGTQVNAAALVASCIHYRET